MISVSFAVNNNNATIEILSGSNYKRWRSDIEFVLGMMDLDMALREDEPPKPTNESTEAMRAHYAKWERSNHLSLISIKRSITEHLLRGIPESNNAKEFLVVVANRYQTSDNAEAGHFMDELMNMRYDDMKGVREHILKMVHLQTRLKALDIPIPDKFIVHQALNTLPSSFSQIKTAYNTLNQSWGVNDLITKCVAEEEKLKREKNESAHLVALGKPNNKKGVEKTRKPNFHSHNKNKNFKRVGVKSRIMEMPRTQTLSVITATKRGIRNLRKPSEKESKLKVSTDIGIDVEHIGVAVLELDSEKADALEMFKVFRTEVEKQLGKVIKIVRSDQGGEYYGKHGDAGQQKGPFARYLQDNGIVAQYTMSGSPERNGVAERRNRTLMEMKRSMMGRSNFPEYLWGEAIKQQPTFSTVFLVTEVKIYDPSLKKTDSRTTRCYFIGYPSHSKGYKFYCSTRGTRIVESQWQISDVNLDVRAFDSGIQQGVAFVNFPTVKISPIVDEIPPVEMRRSQRTRRPALI
ncbi:Retrovirus-related Pol polyprotein from transposon TNT 1-94 [Vitis vinifera]|uniref:Retrovirus-related Pol polyprotein from transposon TNT 1-94 n=1 Tax=Vitis vinifera TaxID=29760 RepID=A0A438CEZ4_VITVI|nr:Retrovirus-related Pol polyprotein from transposon TNT 1-94 [Vitis vinifera]